MRNNCGIAYTYRVIPYSSDVYFCEKWQGNPMDEDAAVDMGFPEDAYAQATLLLSPTDMRASQDVKVRESTFCLKVPGFSMRVSFCWRPGYDKFDTGQQVSHHSCCYPPPRGLPPLPPITPPPLLPPVRQKALPSQSHCVDFGKGCD